MRLFYPRSENTGESSSTSRSIQFRQHQQHPEFQRYHHNIFRSIEGACQVI